MAKPPPSLIAAYCLAAVTCKGEGERILSVDLEELPEGGEVFLETGMELLVRAPVHGSVGFEPELESAAPALLSPAGSKVAYAHPERMGAGMSGADEGRMEFLFKALAPGEARLDYRMLFRGSLDQERSIRVRIS